MYFSRRILKYSLRDWLPVGNRCVEEGVWGDSLCYHLILCFLNHYYMQYLFRKLHQEKNRFYDVLSSPVLKQAPSKTCSALWSRLHTPVHTPQPQFWPPSLPHCPSPQAGSTSSSLSPRYPPDCWQRVSVCRLLLKPWEPERVIIAQDRKWPNPGWGGRWVSEAASQILPVACW